jgi:hypothetical protein
MNTQLTVTTKKEVPVKFIKLSVAVRYEEEDIPNDFPLRTRDMWNATIDVDTHKILDWPQGKTGEFYMKICDQGSYFLLDSDKKVITSIEGDYVPNSLLPGEYGDYLEMKIGEDGTVLNWLEGANCDEFEDGED